MSAVEPELPSANSAVEVSPLTADAARDESIPLTKENYDPLPQEDAARRWIAFILLGLLIFICLSAFLIILILPSHIESAFQVLQIIFTPVIALVSAATGFYYGTRK